jgi:glucose dehydrogenase
MMLPTRTASHIQNVRVDWRGRGGFGIRGSLSAYSLRDGKLKWRWYATDATHWRSFASTVSGEEDDPDRDVDGERADYGAFPNAWKRGGGAIWTTPAIDEHRNVMYFSTGNPWPDSVGHVRPGDNLFTDCIVALDAVSGKLRWYFQEVRHDMRDRDAASPPVLVETKERGRSVDAVAEVSKTGWLYILDRDTGRLIRRSQNVGLLTTMPNPAPAASEGGSSWSPVSVNPTLGYAIICSTHNARHSSTGDVAARAMPTRKQALSDRYGIASAVDLVTGKVVWQDQFDLGLVGGSVSTSGGLTFIGEAFGDFDAIDTRTGKLLWQFQTGAGVNAAPMVFRAGAQEFVAVASGGSRQLGTRYGDAVFVFHLMR